MDHPGFRFKCSLPYFFFLPLFFFLFSISRWEVDRVLISFCSRGVQRASQGNLRLTAWRLRRAI